METGKKYVKDINGCSIETPTIYSGTADPSTLTETDLKDAKDGDIYLKYS